MAHDEHRGFHAHRRLWQAMVAMSGGVAIELDDGGAVRGLALTECDQCLIVPPGLWRVISLDYARRVGGCSLNI